MSDIKDVLEQMRKLSAPVDDGAGGETLPPNAHFLVLMREAIENLDARLERIEKGLELAYIDRDVTPS